MTAKVLELHPGTPKPDEFPPDFRPATEARISRLLVELARAITNIDDDHDEFWMIIKGAAGELDAQDSKIALKIGGNFERWVHFYTTDDGLLGARYQGPSV